jgi:alpha-D-ribose 1-methylphosphonate 5-triphosphate synthase subunit PhnH
MNGYSLFLLTAEDNELNNFWVDINLVSSNITYYDASSNIVGTMVLRQYSSLPEQEHPFEVTLPSKSVLFVTPTMYSVDTFGGSKPLKRYVTSSYEGNVYHVVQYHNSDRLYYTFDIDTPSDLRSSSSLIVSKEVNLPMLVKTPFKDPDTEPFGVMFSLHDQSSIDDDRLVVTGGRRPVEYSFIDTPYIIGRPDPSPFFADFTFGITDNALNMTPENTITILESEDLYQESVTITPFGVDYLFDADTNLVVTPQTIITILESEDLYQESVTITPFGVDYLFDADTNLVVTPQTIITILESEDLYQESVTITPFGVDYLFDADTNLVVTPQTIITILESEDLYQESVTSTPFGVDYLFDMDTNLVVTPQNTVTTVLNPDTEVYVYPKPPIVVPYTVDYRFDLLTFLTGEYSITDVVLTVAYTEIPNPPTFSVSYVLDDEDALSDPNFFVVSSTSKLEYAFVTSIYTFSKNE